MSILIKEIDLPKDAQAVQISYWTKDGHYIAESYPPSRIVEIPTPHGRIIDADLFKELIKDSVPSWAIGVTIPTYGDMDIMDKIYFIPTILEEEK